MIGFRKSKPFLFFELEGVKCCNCLKRYCDYKTYFDNRSFYLCKICFISIDTGDIEHAIKYNFDDIVRRLRSDIPPIIQFYIGKYTKQRNRCHKLKRLCYHKYKSTCKSIYMFCLIAKHYFGVNRDLRLKISKLLIYFELSEYAIAHACFSSVTIGPFFDPACSLPSRNSFITLLRFA
jgi:hypothetical protein